MSLIHSRNQIEQLDEIVTSPRFSSSFMPINQFNSMLLQLTVRPNFHQWIKLFISASVPLMIGILTITVTLIQEKNATKQREQDKQEAILSREQSERQADNLRRDTILATYFDDISKLLLLQNRTKILLNIRANTLTTLRQLDSQRKKYLLLFLYENELIYRHPSQSISTILNVNTADFNDISFKGTIENKCSFRYLYLYDVYLSNSSFIDCYIDGANFSQSTMYRTSFINTLILRTSFKFTLLDKSQFLYTRLSDTSFLGASLVECDFTGSTWSTPVPTFTNANLSRAILSDDQLNNATIYNAILPNGTWGPIQNKNLVVNGNAEEACSINGSNISNGWTVGSNGDIKTFAYPDQNNTKDFRKCYFRVTAFFQARPVAAMYQTVNLEQFSLLISTSNARYNASVNFQCFGNQYGSIELRFIDFNGLRYKGIDKGTLDSTHMQSVELSDIVHWDVRSVEIWITFVTTEKSNNSNATLDQHYCICDNVQFSITKA